MQADKEVTRLINHLLDNAYKLIALVGRDRNTFLELNTGTPNTRVQKARTGTKEQEAQREQRKTEQQSRRARQSRQDRARQSKAGRMQARQDKTIRCRKGTREAQGG